MGPKGPHVFLTFIAQSRPPDPPPDSILAQFKHCFIILFISGLLGGVDYYKVQNADNFCYYVQDLTDAR